MSASVAILIPAYNSASTIGETLNSIAASQGGLSEVTSVILADDASTDDTIAVATRAWTAAVPLIVNASSQNNGERRNVNRVLHELAASHDWVLILHADDLAKPHWLIEMLGLIAHAGARTASVCSSYDVLHADGRVEPGEDDATRAVEVVAGNAASVRSTLLRGCWWHLSGCGIRLAAVQDVGGFDEAMPQKGDWEWLLRVLSSGWAIEYAARTLTLYRQHAASVSSRSFRELRDIRETLVILRRYAAVLSAKERVKLHAANIKYSLRRGVTAVLRGDVSGAGRAVGMAVRVAAHLRHVKS